MLVLVAIFAMLLERGTLPTSQPEVVMNDELKGKILTLCSHCDRDLDFVKQSEEPFQHTDSLPKLMLVQRLAAEVKGLVESIPDEPTSEPNTGAPLDGGPVDPPGPVEER